MNKLTQEIIEELRIKLEHERMELEDELAEHGRILDDSGEWVGVSESDGEESDPSDVADTIEELITNVPLVEELEEKHIDVVDALEKIEHGMYGICEVSGEMIPLERLQALPSARTTIEYAEDF